MMTTPDDFRLTVLQGLYKDALKGNGTDLEVRVPTGGKESIAEGDDAKNNDTIISFHLHHNIVAASSGYFATFPEPKCGRVIADVDSDVFSVCVKFMYTGELVLSRDNVSSILHASELLNIGGLNAKCISYLEHNLDHPNYEHVVELADRFNNPDLKMSALRFESKDSSRDVLVGRRESLVKHIGIMKHDESKIVKAKKELEKELGMIELQLRYIFQKQHEEALVSSGGNAQTHRQDCNDTSTTIPFVPGSVNIDSTRQADKKQRITPRSSNKTQQKKKQHFKKESESVQLAVGNDLKCDLSKYYAEADSSIRSKPKQDDGNTKGSAGQEQTDESVETATTASPTNINDTDTKTDEPPPAPKNETESERTTRLLREAREKSAATKEKKSKKAKKYDKWLRQEEDKKATRAKYWHDKITKENETVDLITQLIITEFLRQNKYTAFKLTKERVLTDSHASEIVTQISKEAYSAFFGSLKCRIKVDDHKRKDLNGRQGWVRYWDGEQGKFCVGLDTKKGNDCDLQYFIPENLDATGGRVSGKNMTRYKVVIEGLFTEYCIGLGCRFVLEMSDVTTLQSAASIDAGLKAFTRKRTAMETRSRIEAEKERRRHDEEEESRKQGEVERKRRAARRAAERAMRRQANDERRRRHREREFRMKQATAQRKMKDQIEGQTMDGHRRRLEESIVPILKEIMENNESPEHLNRYLKEKGMVLEDFHDSADEDKTLVDFLEYKQKYLEKEEGLNKKMAQILGVEADSNGLTLKDAFMKMALKYNPDYWRADNDHGMTKEETEEHFQLLQDAYNQLMSRFDDDAEEEEDSFEDEEC